MSAPSLVEVVAEALDRLAAISEWLAVDDALLAAEELRDLRADLARLLRLLNGGRA